MLKNSVNVIHIWGKTPNLKLIQAEEGDRKREKIRMEGFFVKHETLNVC